MANRRQETWPPGSFCFVGCPDNLTEAKAHFTRVEGNWFQSILLAFSRRVPLYKSPDKNQVVIWLHRVWLEHYRNGTIYAGEDQIS